MSDTAYAWFLGVLAIVSAAAVWLSIPYLMPLFRRYAMARPNVRSSHRTPTPQGGGVPVIAAVLVIGGVSMFAGVMTGPVEQHRYYTLALFALLALALLGAADDIRPMPARTRFLVQTILAAVVVFAAPGDWRLLADWIPQTLERAVLVIGFVWMVNLTNFMDGIDGMLVAETVPVGAVVAILSAFGLVSANAGMIAAVLAGAMLGFGWFNQHPARLFMGDVGSLPIGFLIAALMFELAARHGLAAGLLPPLFFLTDATSTLFAGLAAGHDVSKAHRRHAYQRAVDGGWRAPGVTRVVLGLNIVLAALAAVAIWSDPDWGAWLALAAGLACCTGVLLWFRAGDR